VGTAVGHPPKMTTTNMADALQFCSELSDILLQSHEISPILFFPQLHPDERSTILFRASIVSEHPRHLVPTNVVGSTDTKMEERNTKMSVNPTIEVTEIVSVGSVLLME
jgi:hypothetical protein